MNATSIANCLDPVYAFSSSDSLFQCFQGFASQDSSPPYYADYGYNGIYVNPNSTFGLVIGECIEQYCLKPDSALNGCDRSDKQILRVVPPDHFSASGCASINSALNQDFSGPGMMIAYLMQALIVFYLWLLIRGLHTVPKCIRALHPHKGDHRSMLSASTEETLSRHTAIAKSVLVDFQEAQCFFIACIQAAVLVAFAGNSIVLNASSFSQLQANYAEATWISVAATTSVTFGLWILHRFQLDSAYIHLWSATSNLLSGITLYSRIPEKPDLSRINWNDGLNHLDKCGNHPPPLVYCSYSNHMVIRGDVDYTNIINYIIRRAVVPCFAIYAVIGLQKMGSYLPRVHKVFTSFARRPRAIQLNIPFDISSRVVSILTTIWMTLAESFLLGATISVVIGDGQKLLYNLQYDTADPNTWAFGQIIAVTIWAPLMIKYIYWVVFGTESYSATRFSKPFHIIQVDVKTPL
ncbi:hypothetical protein BDW62DRAFT_202857 [Aspergillus aurantiobrunneus]